ncbi:hypothetical protein HK105_200016 [Polyrhizophydium stewartii]|uniref:Uncharacterized protein n=1 Tax=Polyrhizophydium stewartii TaxID=2732419 RepID=A0ABR4NKD8_9FUNG
MSSGRDISNDDLDNLLAHQADAALAAGNLPVAWHSHMRLANSTLVKLTRRAEALQLAEGDAGHGDTLALVAALESQVASIRKIAELAARGRGRPAASASAAAATQHAELAVPARSAASSQAPDRLLPLIQLSPLVHTLAAHSQQYASASALYRKMTAPGPSGEAQPPSLISIRRLLEDVKIEHSRVTETQAQMAKFETALITAFSAASLALHLAAISAPIFKAVDVRGEMAALGQGSPTSGSLSILDRIPRGLRRCLDWQQYLRNIAVAAVVTATPDRVFGPHPPRAREPPPTAAHAQAAALDTVVATALQLVHVYHDLASAAALVAALESAAVRSLEGAWKLVLPLTNEHHAHLVGLLGAEQASDQAIVALAQIIGQHRALTSATAQALVAVPSVTHAIQHSVEIYAAYTLGTDPSGVATLTEHGARAFQDLVGLLCACQANKPFVPQLPIFAAATASSVGISLPAVQGPLPPAPQPLGALAPSNLALVHWLLTRVYHDDETLDAYSRRLHGGANADVIFIASDKPFWVQVAEATKQRALREAHLADEARARQQQQQQVLQPVSGVAERIDLLDSLDSLDFGSASETPAGDPLLKEHPPLLPVARLEEDELSIPPSPLPRAESSSAPPLPQASSAAPQPPLPDEAPSDGQPQLPPSLLARFEQLKRS